VHSVLGEVYGTSGREQDAIREFQRAIQLAPANAEAPRELARVYENLGRFDEAEASYILATKSRPTDWYGHQLLGLFYYRRERYPQAEVELNNAKSLAPDNEQICRNLGSVYVMQGRYQEAVAELQRSLTIKSNAPTYAALATAYYYEHRFQEAVSAVETAIDLDSSRYRFWGNLGIYYKWAPGNEAKSAPALRKGIELASKFLETTPKNYDVRTDLAEYKARLGDAKGAMEQIESIPQPARKSRASQLAIAYELTGHRDKAIELIRLNLTSAATLNQIKDDPDLAGLWKDPQFQRAIQGAARGSR
jgi:Flp pilus assembly protein TadD